MRNALSKCLCMTPITEKKNVFFWRMIIKYRIYRQHNIYKTEQITYFVKPFLGKSNIVLSLFSFTISILLM